MPVMLTSDLDYELPPSLIAAHPVEPRDHSRLFVYHRAANRVEHRRFYDLPAYLQTPDLLILNDTRVIPARLELRKTTGAAIPGLFLAQPRPGSWQVMLRTRGKVHPGDVLLDHAAGYRFTVTGRLGEKGMWELAVDPPRPAGEVLAAIGHTPLPPYIEKMRNSNADDESFDRAHYQTVYAREGRSLAAPTAGLHFTPELLAKIDAQGIRRAAVTLEVGLGTFLPIETPTLEAHPMHCETYTVPDPTAAALRARRSAGGRIVVVGTTAVRTLESAAERILAGDRNIHGETRLLISPGYQFRLTDVLLTNFHLPRSTLIALVAALVGLPKLKELYAIAIAERYRFYSYGDAMLII